VCNFDTQSKPADQRVCTRTSPTADYQNGYSVEGGVVDYKVNSIIRPDGHQMNHIIVVRINGEVVARLSDCPEYSRRLGQITEPIDEIPIVGGTRYTKWFNQTLKIGTSQEIRVNVACNKDPRQTDLDRLDLYVEKRNAFVVDQGIIPEGDSAFYYFENKMQATGECLLNAGPEITPFGPTCTCQP